MLTAKRMGRYRHSLALTGLCTPLFTYRALQNLSKIDSKLFRNNVCSIGANGQTSSDTAR
jgi:hypothetical protein